MLVPTARVGGPFGLAGAAPTVGPFNTLAAVWVSVPGSGEEWFKMGRSAANWLSKVGKSHFVDSSFILTPLVPKGGEKSTNFDGAV